MKYKPRRPWEDYISEPFLSKVANQASIPKITKRPGLVLIDLYNLVFEGGTAPIADLIDEFPATCGQAAHQCVERINSLIALFRKHELPIFFSTKDFERSRLYGNATRRPRRRSVAKDYEIYKGIDINAKDTVIKKLKASVFFETNLKNYLIEAEVDSLVIAGESTSGCVRASVVDGFSHDYPVSVIEDCVFDQNEISHAVNLYDMHHKYAIVCALTHYERAMNRCFKND